MVNEVDYVELGLSCADVCKALDRGMGGRGLDKLSQAACNAIHQLTTCAEQVMHMPGDSLNRVLNRRTIAEIQRKVIKQSGRNSASRLFYAKYDKETIAAWKMDLNRILQIFNVRPDGPR